MKSRQTAPSGTTSRATPLLRGVIAPAAALAMLLLLGGCEKASAPTPATTSAVVTDATTGLRWLRCAMGQTWEDGRCKGEALTLDLMDAQVRVEALNARQYEGITQWRLPTIVELAALRRCDHGLVEDTFTLEMDPWKEPVTIQRWCARETTIPTIDATRFPDTPPLKFWSGSGSEAHQHSYAVDFGNAWIGINEAAESTYAVRPVADAAR